VTASNTTDTTEEISAAMASLLPPSQHGPGRRLQLVRQAIPLKIRLAEV